jgi:hypothetical protein
LIDQEEVAERVSAELFARQSLYLIERGYFKLSDLPKMTHFAAAVGLAVPEEEVVPEKEELLEEDGFQEFRQDELMMLNALSRFLAGKMQVLKTDPLPEYLAGIKDPKNFRMLEKSFFNHFQKTKFFRNEWRKFFQREWERFFLDLRNSNQKENGQMLWQSIEPMNARDMYTYLLQFASGTSFMFGGSPDRLSLKLNHPHKPLISNGKWLNKNEVLEEGDPNKKGPGLWKEVVLDDNKNVKNANGLPAFCYAVWVLPNEQFQKTHFGEVLLEKTELAGYCLWHASLTPAEAAEWNGFVKTLKPATYEKQFHNPNLSPSLKRRIDELSAIDALYVPDPDAPPPPQSEGCSN